VTIEEFNIYLENIFFLFMEKTQSGSFLKSFVYLRDRIKERKIPFNVSLEHTPRHKQRELDFIELTNKNNDEFCKTKKKSIKTNSPFTDYFNAMIGNLSIYLQDNDGINSKKNLFYQPDLFRLFKNQLYLAPVWSGIFINLHFKQKEEFYSNFYYEKKIPTKLENNRVESRFDNLKNDVLQANQVYPSEYAKLTFSQLHSQYIDPNNDFINRQNELSKQMTSLDKYDDNNILVKKVQTEFPEPKEKWDDSKGKKKKSNNKRKHGQYFDNYSNFGFIYGKPKLSFLEMDSEDFDDNRFDSLIKACEGNEISTKV